PSYGTQSGDRTALAEARGDDEVAARGVRLCTQGCDRGRRMLQVGIHHADPGGAGSCDSGDDCASEPAVALAGLTMDHGDLELATGPGLDDRLRGGVIRVVDHDELGVNAGERLVEADDEIADDGLLV